MTTSTKLFFAPGPIRIPEIVKHTFLYDPPYFTTNDFSALLQDTQVKLKTVFNTTDPVMIGTGSGSLAMEACILNFFNEGDEVLFVTAGKYGDNWIKMGNLHGLKVMQLVINPEQNQSYDHFKILVRTNKFKGVFITHVETTTGYLNDISKYKAIIEEEAEGKCLLIVDAVSSLLTEHIHHSDYDVLISASQKALQCPPGLFFMVATEDAIADASDRVKRKLFYFDVKNEYNRTLQHRTTFTPGSGLILALNTALEIILDIGPANIIKETQSFANYVRTELQHYFVLFPASPCNAVSAFRCNDSSRFLAECEKAGLILGAGLRDQNDKIFRIMHFGWDLRRCEVDAALRIITLLRKSW